MGRWLFIGLSALLGGAVGQTQYRPEGGAGGGASGPDSSARGASSGEESGTVSGGSLEETIPGVPGDDYPIFAEVPDTAFECDGLVEGGYYADVEAECQVFHICGNDGNGGLTKYSFLCPNGTIFQQQYFVCDWWFNVDCSLAEDLYTLNDQYAAEREANNGAFGERINTDNDGKDGEVREKGSSGESQGPLRGSQGSSPSQAKYGGNSEAGTRARVASGKKSRRGRNYRPSQRHRTSRKSSSEGSTSNDEDSLSGYGSNNAGTGHSLTGGYEAIGSPGFGGQGSFGPDGLFSADYPALPGYGSEDSSSLGNYNRNARDILDNYFDDYINLQDYSL